MSEWYEVITESNRSILVETLREPTYEEIAEKFDIREGFEVYHTPKRYLKYGVNVADEVYMLEDDFS